ncbi:hypothetical protein [uncultured Gammaproteobacteria bacterium]|nr:hypothetical protein [uncultured Gammaproteobacteria bacterium]
MKVLFLLIFATITSYSNAARFDNFDNFARILHYQDGKSLVKNSDFFLSNTGIHDIKSELIALKKSYYLPEKLQNKHPRCLFPDRYFWLSKQIKLKNYTLYPKFCTDLDKWYKDYETKSISVLFVGGYFDNPASVFGHNLIKLNSNDDELLDLSINFGAKIPKNENSIFYILKGLFGGYDARFSNKDFYTQDLIYSKNELREIWDYELNLTLDEIVLIKLHLWAMQENKLFDYYFLKENCAYQLASIIDLVIDMDLPKNKPWYIPIEFIDKLYDQKNRIKKITYKPSSEKILIDKFEALSKVDAIIIKNIINGDMEVDKLQENKVYILDLLIDYYDYLLIKDKDNKKINNKRINILIKRFKSQDLSSKKVYKNKSQYTKPSNFSIVTNEENLYINFSIYNSSLTNIYNDGSSELIAPRIRFKYSYNNKAFKFDEFDLFKIIKLNKSFKNFMHEKYSWKAQLGVKNIQDKVKITSSIGLGKMLFNDEKNNIYIMSLFDINKNKNKENIKLSLNYLLKTRLVTSLFSYSTSAKGEYYQVELRKQITDNTAIFIKIDENNNNFGVNYSF